MNGVVNPTFLSKSTLELLNSMRGTDGLNYATQKVFKDRETFNGAIKFLHERKLIRVDYKITTKGLVKVYVITTDGGLLLRLLSI